MTTATETRTAVSSTEFSRAESIAREIASLVAAGKITIACKSVDRVSIWGDAAESIYSLAGETRVIVDVRGETVGEIAETLALVRDAAQALKCRTFTMKKNRDGGSYASQPRFDSCGNVMDYFAKIVIKLP